jgi:hypothetical protein
MKRLLIAVLTLTIAATFTTANAQTDTRKKEFNLDKSSVAIQGYDPVAYFTQNKAVKGSKDIALFHEGITYYFASTQNKELFKANPGKYEPQYGGWCAYAMGASGEKVEIDPETFKITNGKLYLFYHSWVNNTLTKWNKDESNLRPKADASWMKFFH